MPSVTAQQVRIDHGFVVFMPLAAKLGDPLALAGRSSGCKQGMLTRHHTA